MSSKPFSELVINHDVSLILIEPQPGAPLLDLPGRVMLAAAQANACTQMVSQSSSTGSLCLCVPRPTGIEVVGVLYDTLRRELASGIIRQIDIRNDVAVLTAVGAVRDGVHLFGKLTQALAAAGVNILVAASGFSGCGASVVIDTHQVGIAHQLLDRCADRITVNTVPRISKH
jgi:aspartokinase/homoserine dehydrogenase 1